MDKTISALVTGKARRYLRTSTALFLLSLVLAGSYLVVVERQYLQNRVDFTDNANVHLIKVTGPAATGAGDALRFADIDAVRRAVGGFAGVTPDVSAEFALGFGIPDADGVDRFVYGIGDDGARLLGLPALENGIAYTAGAPAADSIALRIPVVRVEDGGMSSGESVDRTLRLAGGVGERTPLSVLSGPDPEALYVSEQTFRGIVETAFHITWADFEAQYDRENIFGTDVVRNVWVYVGDLDAVTPVATAIGRTGYSTTYTLQAFDDLAGSLSASALIGLITVVIACTGCFLYIALTFGAYLNVSHKDMAILKHFGFDSRQLARAYAHRARRLFGGVALAAGGYVVAAGLVLLPDRRPAFIAADVLLCWSLAGLLYLLVRWVLIPRHVGRDVLTLLKADREFE